MSATDTSSRVSRFRSAVAEGWTRERFGVLGALALILITFAPPFQVYLFTDFLVVSLFALGFNLLYGYTGLLSFGHGLFYAGGAYGIAIVLRDLGPMIADIVGTGISPLVTFMIGGVVGLVLVIIVAVPVGWLSVRLQEIYFALITLAFGMLGYSLIIQDPAGLTNGTDGVIVLLGTVDLGGTSLRIGGRRIYYVISTITVVAATYGVWRIVNSPFGTICKAIRESPDRAAALGIDASHHRWMTFIISAAVVGIAGVLRAGLASVASPGLTHWSTSAIAVIATVIGGATYFYGPFVGAFIFLYIRWAISRFPALEAYWELFFGALLIAVVLFSKQGAVGGLLLLRDRVLGNNDDSDPGGRENTVDPGEQASAASDHEDEPGNDNMATDRGDDT
ncbi:branched-chain amino acid ABC transporter permease [Halorubrum sp. CGM4_25_10-8A]|uniref:branched-chain amino acid ABC transporter permease n=1 Tax=Halorubrum sp. CGM4_25_10-8A TaxID=2518116 RepID=UPI0010F7BD7D|nr:branched-chain amino acid ABC transporter permease [Halorubrum sp. CGM4_25_10-8A]TKX39941.1 branched-chain amino acid ABC transporter permease [Halorubrum sp. CGM4_25_10-8A]